MTREVNKFVSRKHHQDRSMSRVESWSDEREQHRVHEVHDDHPQVRQSRFGRRFVVVPVMRLPKRRPAPFVKHPPMSDVLERRPQCDDQSSDNPVPCRERPQQNPGDHSDHRRQNDQAASTAKEQND